MSLLRKTIKNKFGYDVTALEEVVDNSSNELITRSVTEGRTLANIVIDTDVRGKKKIKLADDSIEYYAADDCSLTEGGSTAFSDVTLETFKIGFQKSFCNDDLVGLWPQLQLRAGAMAGDEALPFEQTLIDYVLALHQKELDKLIWQGDDSLGSGNYMFFDGFRTKWYNSPSVIQANTNATAAITASNALTEFIEIVAAIPEGIRNDQDARNNFVIMCNQVEFDYLVTNMLNNNAFHYYPGDVDRNELTLPGFGYKVMVMPHVPAGEVYAARKDHMFFGTDLASDINEVAMWYDKTDDKIYMRNKFYAGVQNPFNNQVVKWTPYAS